VPEFVRIADQDDYKCQRNNYSDNLHDVIDRKIERASNASLP
jgi:hypothetical protein